VGRTGGAGWGRDRGTVTVGNHREGLKARDRRGHAVRDQTTGSALHALGPPVEAGR